MRLVGDEELFLRNPESLFLVREDFKRPGDDLGAEIIADGEISEHLEERVMARGMADVLDVVRANGFLDVHDAAARRDFAPVEILLEPGDASVDPKQGFIALGNEIDPGDVAMPLSLEKGDPARANLASG